MNNDASQPPEPPAASTTRNDTVLDWVRDTGAGELLAGGLGRYLQRRKRRRRVALASTTCALLLVASVAWFSFNEAPSTSAVVTALTDASATVLRPERQTLADGSTIDLNAGAEVEVTFNEAFRRVVLRKGEAHFQVAKDARRPFVVGAGAIEVRAVGTAFAVDLGASAIDVLVTEGRVDVNSTESSPSSAAPNRTDPAPTGAPPMAALGAGGRIVIHRDASSPAIAAPRISELSLADMNARLAWRVPRLKFSATPLAHVVAMFNEHVVAGRDARLVLASDIPADIRVSGTLRADDIDSLLRLLAGEFGITSETRAGEIVLRQ